MSYGQAASRIFCGALANEAVNVIFRAGASAMKKAIPRPRYFRNLAVRRGAAALRCAAINQRVRLTSRGTLSGAEGLASFGWP